MKNLITPRTLSDAQFHDCGYPSAANSHKSPSGWFKWAGWIAFAALLLAGR